MWHDTDTLVCACIARTTHLIRLRHPSTRFARSGQALLPHAKSACGRRTLAASLPSATSMASIGQTLHGLLR
jgi:hypothetical protein